MTSHHARHGGAIVSLLVLIVIGAGLLSIYLFVPPYWNAWKLNGVLRAIAMKADNLTDEDAVRQYAVKELEKQDYLVKPNDLHITRGDHRVTIEMTYVEWVLVPFTDVTFEITFQRHGSNVATGGD